MLQKRKEFLYIVQKCSDEFIWETIIVDECSADKPCPEGYNCQEGKCVADIVTEKDCFTDLQCPGGGQFFTDYSTPFTVTRYACVNFKCELEETKTVACTPPNIGCPAGEFCNPLKGYICEEQVGPAPVCGDGVCTSPYETSVNCPADCAEEEKELNWTNVLLAILILVIVIGMVALVASKIKWK